MNTGDYSSIPYGGLKVVPDTMKSGHTQWYFHKVVDDIYIINSQMNFEYMLEATPDKKLKAAYV